MEEPGTTEAHLQQDRKAVANTTYLGEKTSPEEEEEEEEEEEDNLGLSFPLRLLRRSSVFGFACPCDWTSDEGRDVGLITAEGEGRCRIGFRLPLAMGNKGGALVHCAGATELVFRDDVDIGASRRRNAGWTFSGFGLARCGSPMR